MDRKVAKLYGVLRPEWFSERATFVIDKPGIIRWVQKMPPYEQRDIEEILDALRQLKQAT